MKNNNIQLPEQTLFNELSHLIEQSKNFVVVQANSVMTMLFWNVGKRINEDILQNKRADYGKRIVPTLSVQLSEKYGKNFELRNLRRMMQFAEKFPDIEIVAPLVRQLSWAHFKELIPLKEEKVRLFYAQEAAERHWGKRELRQSIERKEFERTEIANMQIAAKEPSEQQVIPFNVFKDPYFLDMFNLPKVYAEYCHYAGIGALYSRNGQRFCVCGTAKTNDYRWRRFSFGFTVFPPHTPPVGCNRTETR